MDDAKKSIEEMKVLMFGWEFPPFNSGGLGTACYGLTKGLAKKGVEIAFVLPRKLDIDVDFLKMVYPSGDKFEKTHNYLVNSLLMPYLTQKTYKERYSIHGVKELPPLYGSTLFEEVERYELIGEQIARQEKFDIIHAHDWLTFKAALAAKRISGKYLIVHVHATEFDRTGGNGVNQMVYEIEKRGMEEADMVIAVSNYTKQMIIDKYSIPGSKIRVVHNGIDYESKALRKMHALKKNNKIVLFLGRITIQKGPDYFIYAAKKILKYCPNVVFVIAGSGDMDRFIINKVAEMNLADKVIFTGFLRGEELKKAYEMADVYVMPSVSEPFGITPLEALMHETPVVMSKQSGVSEVVKNCLKIDFWDVDEMANKITAILNYPALSKTLKENGVEEVKHISWDRSAEKCNDIYSEVLR